MRIEEAVEFILRRRGLDAGFPLSSFPPPSAFPGAVESGEALAAALLDGKRICVWGDYDTDGITASALLVRFCRETVLLNGLSAEIGCFIPDRFCDGYGVNAERMGEIKDSHDLMVTVDCGITGHDAIAKARELGLSVIVTDHHLPDISDEEMLLPQALAICDPNLLPKGERERMELSGVGVAFVVARAAQIALAARGFRTPDIRKYLGYVAMGTVVDVASVSSCGRALVKAGMKLLERGSDVWVRAMKKAVGMDPEGFIDSEAMGFRFGPMLNAPGRMEHAIRSLELLLEDDPEKALEKAVYLDGLNRERKRMQSAVQDEAMAQAGKMPDSLNGLVLVGNWSAGVLGIAAARVAQAFGKPVLLCAPDGRGVYKGSGRTFGNVSLYGALGKCGSLLYFGGHEAAAGVGFKYRNLESLRKEFSEACAASVIETPARDHVWDVEVDMSSVTLSNIGCLRELEPIGNGNPRPVFLSEPVEVRDFKFAPAYLRMKLAVNGGTSGAVMWQPKDEPPPSFIGSRPRFFYYPFVSSFEGGNSIEFLIDGWKND